MARRWLLAVALLRLVGGILDAEVQELSEREGQRMKEHWAQPGRRRPRFQVTGEMLAGMPLMRQGLCAFEARFRRAVPPRRIANGGGSRRPYVIAFVGDSTMRNLFHSLCLAMNVRQLGEDQGKHCVASCAGRLLERDRERDSADLERDGRRRPDVVAVFAGSTAVDPDALGRTLRHLEDDGGALGAAWAAFAGDRPPDAVFFGAGLWLQWPTPFAPSREQWTSYPYWLGYERDLGFAIANYSAVAPATRLAISTTHSQCDGQFQNDFKAVVDAAERSGRGAASAECVAWLRSIGVRGRDADCAAGLRSRAASAALNARLARYLGGRGDAPPSVDLVDAFALGDGRCENNLPGDAIHFHGLLYEELTLVFEALGWTPSPPGAEDDCPRARRNWNATR